MAPEPAVQARDQAFERLYQRYVADVYRYSLALLRNPTDAEDVTQTTFMNAYRAFKRGDEIQKPHNWLIKIAHNVARSRYAHASRRVQEVPLEDHIEQLAVPDDDKPNLDTVLRALGRLPFNQRAALVMRELEGRTYAEIAETLGVSVSAVETLIFRARKSLRVKASSLRVLTGVPLPGSLASLFQGGGAVAGSSAIVGAGLVGKALVALVVGAVATGVGGDKSDPASAAGADGARALASVPAPSGSTARSVGAGRAKAPRGWKQLVVGGRAVGVRGAGDISDIAASSGMALGGAPGNGAASATTPREVVVSSAATGSGPSAQAGTANGPAQSVVTLPQAPPVQEVVTTAAQTVVNTVTTPASQVPVNVPAIPSPAIPSVTTPAIPSVSPPPLPPVPAVQAPPLPPAPPLPRLP
jgi:RNA polymerase sigma factor (sigma-70 family)